AAAVELGRLSPVHISRNQEGTMARVAAAQGDLSKARRDTRDAIIEAVDHHTVPQGVEEELAGGGRRQARESVRERARAEPKGQIRKGSMREQRAELPIYQFREEILGAVRDHQFLVVVGETGSGKTTQLTQYLAEAGYASKGVIACTQPRRVAARSVAQRVAVEVGCRCGEEVGFTVRFEDETGPRTRIKYMTDGMLLRESLIDSSLSKYSAIILDEAHERSVPTDVLFGIIKDVSVRRKDLRVIVTSATLDAEKFARYFNDAAIFTIPGRCHPVEILYATAPCEDYVEAAMRSILEIHVTEDEGDVLLFLTGQEEIEHVCERLEARNAALIKADPDIGTMVVLPVFGGLPTEYQQRIFEPAPVGGRKIIVATNIAETSLTVDGIKYVVDPGFVKQNQYMP
ncbi:hypothetical protein KIPB_013309, partial [Kipferlia bialata]